MTQAFNLAQLANNLNTSGQLDATDGLTGLAANSNLASSGTADATTFLRGDRVWATVSSSGRLLQVVQTTYGVRTSQYNNGGTWYDLPSMSLNITPAATSSRILVFAQVCLSTDVDHPAIRLLRNGTAIDVGTNNGGSSNFAASSASVSIGGNTNATQQLNILFLDSPSTTSALTYKIQVQTGSTGTTWSNGSAGGSSNGANTNSVIILAEVGA
jgi:hypothetical protein